MRIVLNILTIIALALFLLPTGDLAASAEIGDTPERIILTWMNDPATSQSVTWRTGLEVANPIAQIAVATENSSPKKNPRTVDATSEFVKIDSSKTVQHHTTNFKGLHPDTLYCYRVGDGNNWSEWNQFKTASDRPKPYKFLYFGDFQSNIKSLGSRVIRGAYAKAPDARFMIHTGDLTSHSLNDKEWGEWFYAAGWITRVIPTISTPGNHEYIKRKTGGKKSKGLTRLRRKKLKRLTPLWRPHFAFPQNGPPGLKELTYYIDYQGTRIISLNSNERFEEQAQWLDKILAKNLNRWTIIAMHHPLFSSRKKWAGFKMKKIFMPLFDKYYVDLVLQGHDHRYSRTYKLYNGKVVDINEPGTIYVASVSGPKMYPFNSKLQHLMAYSGTNIQLYQVISISGHRLSYESWSVTDELYDSFELEK